MAACRWSVLIRGGRGADNLTSHRHLTRVTGTGNVHPFYHQDTYQSIPVLIPDADHNLQNSEVSLHLIKVPGNDYKSESCQISYQRIDLFYAQMF